MKKRLLKAMPHIPIFELRPELREQNEGTDDPDDPHDTLDDVVLNAEDIDEVSASEMEANTTFHNLEAEHTGENDGLLQRVKSLISKKKVNGRNIAVGRTELVRAKDDNMRYGDDESSESDTEEDQHDGLPLVQRNKRK